MLAEYGSVSSGHGVAVERWAVLGTVGGSPDARAVLHAVGLHERGGAGRARMAAVGRLGPAGGADPSRFDPVGRTALLAAAPGVGQEIQARYPAS